MLILFFALLSQAHASIEFVAPKSYTLKTSLPPQIALKYDLGCASKFVKVLREEAEDPKTRETVISLGVLVETDPSRGCAGAKEETVIAGHAYSGRAHRIELMSAYSTQAYSTRAYPDVLQARPSLYGSSKNLKCPIAVVPGQGIGPVSVGSSLLELERLGLELKTVQGSRDLMVIGRMSIGLSRGTVQWVAVELADLPDCVYYGKRKIDRRASPTQLAKIFSGCGEEEMAMGGNSTHCTGVRLGSGGWGGQQKSTSLHVAP